MSALTEQIGGSHYVNLAIQPVQFATTHQYDPCAFSILKYVTRHSGKGGAQDLRKAAHFVRLRAELSDNRTDPRADRPSPSIRDYIEQNRIPDFEALILRLNHWWATTHSLPGDMDAEDLALLLTQLCTEIYGEPL